MAAPKLQFIPRHQYQIQGNEMKRCAVCEKYEIPPRVSRSDSGRKRAIGACRDMRQVEHKGRMR